MAIHTADVVLPVSTAPIAHGAVAVRSGRIVHVGPAAHILRQHPEAEVTEHAGIMTPGLVNAHSHLQYTSFHRVGAHTYGDYTEWSIAFNEEYAERSGGDWAASSRRGVELSLQAGVTCICDIVTDFAARDVLVEAGVPGVAYLELIGIDRQQWDNGVGRHLRQAVSEAPTLPATTVGISPHAPYSLDEPVLRAMGDLARELDVRLHIHVAESDGEEEYFRSGTGSLADRLRIVSARPMPILENGGTGLGIAEFVQGLGLLGPDVHLAHGVYLGSSGRRQVADCGTLVALCPRSNKIVGVDHPPIRAFLDEDIPFAIGTDSLSSSPSLDLLEDVALLARLAESSGYDRRDLDRRLLRAATMGGATALGLDDQLGSLEPGKRADLAVFEVRSGGPLTPDTAERALVRQGAGTCTMTIIGGELRWSRADQSSGDD